MTLWGGVELRIGGGLVAGAMASNPINGDVPSTSPATSSVRRSGARVLARTAETSKQLLSLNSFFEIKTRRYRVSSAIHS